MIQRGVVSVFKSKRHEEDMVGHFRKTFETILESWSCDMESRAKTTTTLAVGKGKVFACYGSRDEKCLDGLNSQNLDAENEKLEASGGGGGKVVWCGITNDASCLAILMGRLYEVGAIP